MRLISKKNKPIDWSYSGNVNPLDNTVLPLMEQIRLANTFKGRYKTFQMYLESVDELMYNRYRCRIINGMGLIDKLGGTYWQDIKNCYSNEVPPKECASFLSNNSKCL